MSSEWPLVRLGAVVEIKHGWPFKSEFFSVDANSSELPIVVAIGNFEYSGGFRFGTTLTKRYSDEYPAEYALRPGETLLVMTCQTAGGEILGIPARIPNDGRLYLHNQRLGRVVPKTESVFNDFLYWLFLHPDFNRHLVNSASGTKILHTAPIRIGSFQFRLPPLPEQRGIASVLDALDDRIALLRETNATLEAIAQALFKSWFVDFDPVRAKMQGRAPEGMDEATAALFPDGLEEAELGLVPRGWRLVPFGQLLCHTIGGDWGSDVPDEKNEVRVAIIRGTDIPDLQSGANSRVPVRYTSQKKLATRKLEDGDIVLEVSGGSKDQPTGRALYLTNGLLGQFDCPAEPASFCRLLRPNTKDIGVLLGQHLTYIYAQGKTWEYQNQSTGIANFQTTHFLETELVAIPTDEVLAVFANTVRPLIDRSHLTQIQELATLRDTLLPRLISGQLRLTIESN